MLGMHQHQDEMTVFLKSIPRMVPSSSSSMEERCCNTIDNNNNNNNNCTIASQTIQQTESEELQFAVDIPNPTSSTTTTTTKSPKQQHSLPKSSVDDATTSQSLLWGGTIEGTISGPSSDMANTLAVSSLAHRCATDGKIRLRMFDKNNVATKDGGGATNTAMETSVTTTTGGDVIGGGGGVNGGNNNNNNAYHPAHRTHDPQLSSIEDQLSDFRSFGISLK
jgi:hypothetical protein